MHNRVIKAPIFFYFPVRGNSGYAFSKQIGKMIQEKIKEAPIPVHKDEGFPGQSLKVIEGPVGEIISSRFDQKFKTLVGTMRLLDESLDPFWDPVHMHFTVGVLLESRPDDGPKIIEPKHVRGIGGGFCFLSEIGLAVYAETQSL
jgi:hypothetical protein